MTDFADLYARPLRLLFYDIETAPLLGFFWQLNQDWINPEMVEQDWFMFCWSAKWSDGTQVLSKVLTSKEAKAQDDRRIVESLAELIRKADIIVAHNGNAFDVKKLNSRLVYHGLEPLGQTQMIDTLTIARGTFKFTSNKLDYLAKFLGLPGKLPTGFALWRDCYHGSKAALEQMVAYNRNDVLVLERVFHKLMPHAKTLPRLVDAVEYHQDVCPTCGSRNHRKDGLYRTKASTFQRFRCDGCGRRFRGRQTLGSQKTAGVPL
jgi:DNA polymerase elongation subunit (family B)